MTIVNPNAWDNDNRAKANLREARKAYFSHENECECELCEFYLEELADIAAHGPLDENFDPADGASIPEDDRGAYQD